MTRKGALDEPVTDRVNGHPYDQADEAAAGLATPPWFLPQW